MKTIMSFADKRQFPLAVLMSLLAMALCSGCGGGGGSGGGGAAAPATNPMSTMTGNGGNGMDGDMESSMEEEDDMEEDNMEEEEMEGGECPGTGQYEATFRSEWSSTSHGSTPPGSAHFTSLVGTTHNANATFWEVGGIATNGIEGVAELGATSTFRGTDVKNAMDAGNAGAYLSLGGLGRHPSEASNSFSVSEDFPLLTLISMIAPTPDWFVGVSSLNLKGDDGCWRTSITESLIGYDAGTEPGTTFNLGSSQNPPHEPIGKITALPGSVREVPFATLILTLVTPE